MKKFSLFLLLIALLSLSVSAQDQYHLKLLAVQEDAKGNLTGSGADLYLELKEGSGRVFLDTFPVTKMDTQISTRFAKEIACNQYDLPCQKYDFIYTIKAQSNIIGGPSAGAAIAALTTIAVMDLDYDDDNVAVTGTINSGGIVGPVGGTKEKIEAAANLGLTKVLIAEGTAAPAAEENQNNESIENPDNSTEYLNLTKYAAEELGVEVVGVTNLDQVIFHLTGKDLNHKEIIIEENEQYTQIMSDLRDVLCTRVEKIEMELHREGIPKNETVTKRVEEQKAKADNATLQKDYYSAASYCFTASIVLRNYYYAQEKPTLSQLWKQFMELEEKAEKFEEELSQQEIETLSDLQTLIIVKDRLNEVKEQIAKFREQPSNNEQKKEEIYNTLSYSEERYFSAVAWSDFFSMDGKALQLDKEHIRQSCVQKTLEAEERYQYISLFINVNELEAIAEKITAAKEASQEGEYELCLMKAILAKADANAVLSALGLGRNELSGVLESKSLAVKRVLAENTAEGKFPILGYSYFQYATSLKEQEPVTALFYLEYALEMGDLNLYFPEEKSFLTQKLEHVSLDTGWLSGFLTGMIITVLILTLRSRKTKKYFKRK